MLDILAKKNQAFMASMGKCPDRTFPMPDPEKSAKRPLDFTPFGEALAGFSAEQVAKVDAAVKGKTILQLQEYLEAGALTSEQLVLYYLQRIQKYDENRLNSVIELNPDALLAAKACDAARAAAAHGPLFGIPIMLKDNIATAAPMHTTAGNYALKDWQAGRDAFLVKQLRDAGAIILGKNNLSEWANYNDPCMPNGFSSLGGQTRNPYGPYDTLGSSSGSAVSVSADLTTLSVGSETAGSLVQPARANGVVGMRPSKGLVSGDYVVPLEPTLDTAGPMGRSVTDVAVLLSVLAATDPNEPHSADAAALANTDFTQWLSLDEARKLRVGVVRFDAIARQVFENEYTASSAEQQQMLDIIAPLMNGATQKDIELLKSQAIAVVEIKQSELPVELQATYTAFIAYGFQDGIKKFFGQMDPPAPIQSLDDVVRVVNEDSAARAPYGQRYVEASAKTDVTAEQYQQAVGEAQQCAEAWISGVLQTHKVDLLLAGTLYTTAGSAGTPTINIPTGRAADPASGAPGAPTGLYLTGPYLSDAKLIAVAYALEQALPARVAPDLDTTIEQIESVVRS
jgi:amidase